VRQLQAGRREAIEVRRFDLGMAKSGQISVTKIIGHHQDYVRSPRSTDCRRSKQQSGKPKAKGGRKQKHKAVEILGPRSPDRPVIGDAARFGTAEKAAER